MKPMNSVKIIEDFWTAVWKAPDPGAVDDFVVGDLVITTGGVEIESRQKFKGMGVSIHGGDQRSPFRGLR